MPSRSGLFLLYIFFKMLVTCAAPVSPSSSLGVFGFGMECKAMGLSQWVPLHLIFFLQFSLTAKLTLLDSLLQEILSTLTLIYMPFWQRVLLDLKLNAGCQSQDGLSSYAPKEGHASSLVQLPAGLVWALTTAKQPAFTLPTHPGPQKEFSRCQRYSTCPPLKIRWQTMSTCTSVHTLTAQVVSKRTTR